MVCVAAVQMASGPNVKANLIEAARLIGEAVNNGAGLVVLPENFAIMGLSEYDKLNNSELENHGPIQKFLSQQAARYSIWLVGGTVPLETRNRKKVRASCLLFDDTGQRVARYDKVHLFDVELQDSQQPYTESLTIEAGQRVVVADTPYGRLGLAVCYDLRFPELFRCMLDREMQILALPAAFTAVTGKAHWEVLVRARAIENLCYVIAAGQGGFHLNGRETYGDSMIVEPWGTILGRLPRGTGIVTADVDIARVTELRRIFPVEQHRFFRCDEAEEHTSK
jgi:predicted amidohydrolase